MNTDLKLNFKFNRQATLDVLKRSEETLVGLALIGVFGYTALVVERATNVQPNPVAPSAVMVFDQPTIDSLKHLTVVNGDTPLGSLGKSDPFGR